MKTVKEIRADLGMTQAQFSEAFGIPPRTIQDWENNRRTPPPYVIRLLNLAAAVYRQDQRATDPRPPRSTEP
jgi:DNA-binding transcriptional regulator YiaG